MNDIKDLGFAKTAQTNQDDTLMDVNAAKAVAEVQAAYVIAKKFPRDQTKSYLNIITTCKRSFFAEQSMYAYPKGGKMVEGPSIRLAEALARDWGNIDCGVKELSQANRTSVAEAYAIDLETNTRVTKIFHVPHYRDTKKGRKTLTDSRDIYELVANQGARRLRACILAVIPADVTEEAVSQCRKTLESSDVPIKDQVRKMVIAFDEYGVKSDNLEKFLGHNIDATIPAEIVRLKSVYKSIKDGMAKREDFFDIKSATQKSSEDNLDEMLAKKSLEKKRAEKEKIVVVDAEVYALDVKTLEKIILDKKLTRDTFQELLDKENATSFKEIKHEKIKELIKKYGN